MNVLLDKINRLKYWQAAIIIAAVGVAVFSAGLTNQFQGDDSLQIVTNPVVHSVSHIGLFFEGGTFYNGGGIAPLSGTYYRPLMTTTFSLIYTLFGPHPVYFHLVQLLLCIGGAFLLYLFFRYSFNPVLALFLALVFLVHPLNSQVAFAIPSMQDALFFFFGMLGLWWLVRFKSLKSLGLVAAWLLLSLLAKETAVVFIAMAMLSLFWWDRRRLLPFLGVLIVPVGLWLALKIHAVGLIGASPNNSPIAHLSLGGRLITMPSVILFYLSKFIFPWRLGSAYYWTHSTYSTRYFLVPLIIELLVAAAIIGAGIAVGRRCTKAIFYTYLFFVGWMVIGMLPFLQLIPLDFTASEPWFYFSMAGWLGMIGSVFVAFQKHVKPVWFLVAAAIILALLGVRTGLRAGDWRNQSTLAVRDIVASPTDYNAYNNRAVQYLNQNNYQAAIPYLRHSIAINPAETNYNNLGWAYLHTGDYAQSLAAYNKTIAIQANVSAIQGKSVVLLVYGNYNTSQSFMVSAVKTFPTNDTLWTNLAVLEQAHGDNQAAQSAITEAIKNGPVSSDVYYGIMSNRAFTYSVAGLNFSVK